MDFQDIISALTDLDQSLGHLEEIIITDEFKNLQASFIEENCHYFGETENKDLPMEEIYYRYKNLIGNYIDRTLAERSSRLDLQNIFDQMHRKKQ
ncbi:unnamed protein product [Hymenolepis diminuta]|uniref:ADP-ribosylation factor-like protein 2-binding protein n=1 Tax=Hymenolepis diminuta TaxID=6216 RepID=A0A564YCH8_HYMDI|nr:unnamed protein product [Hymenolepis diminuta]